MWKENEKPAFKNDETKPVRNASESMSCPFISASGKQISVSASKYANFGLGWKI